jgi:hypothetical protein
VSIADELRKLDELRRSGSLTDQEFAQAKVRLLTGSPSSSSEPVAQHLSDQLAEVRYQNELAQVDREWEIEREKYYVTDRYGRRQLPTSGMGIGIAVIGGVFGLFWMIMTVAITGSAPDVGPFAVVKVVFPLLGVVFILAAIAVGRYCYSRAQAYEKALAAYQVRRNALRSEHMAG